MMISTEPRTEGIEHLDHKPACTNGRRHTSSPPPAKYWLDQHGCCEHLVCAGCYTETKAWHDWAAARGLPVQCCDCWRNFASFDDCFRVVPL